MFCEKAFHLFIVSTFSTQNVKIPGGGGGGGGGDSHMEGMEMLVRNFEFTP